MHSLLWLTAATATPSPSVTVDAAQVTPGTWGFVAIAVVAVAVVFLLIDMLRRIRRAGYRYDIQEELDAEEAAAAAASADAGSTDAPDTSTDTDKPTAPPV